MEQLEQVNKRLDYLLLEYRQDKSELRFDVHKALQSLRLNFLLSLLINMLFILNL